MKKKIISLLLALVIIVGILPSATFAADTETDVGRYAQFNGDYGDENSFFVLEAEPVSTADMMEYYIYEFSEDLLFEITNAKVLEESYDITDQQTGEVIGQKIVQSLWYQIKVLDGTAPEDFADDYWIMQNYLSEEDMYEQDVLILSNPQDHTWCEICGEYDCQDHTQPEEPAVPSVSDTVTDDAGMEYVVTVTGNALPEGVTLEAKELDVTQIPDFPWEMYGLTSENYTLDLTMWNGSEKWQPGAPVEVSIPAEVLGYADGEEFVAIHRHVDDNGEVYMEILGPYTVKDGIATVIMESFSTITVEKNTGTMKIEGVGAFFEAYSATTGNSNYEAVGVYADTDGNIHVIMEGMSNNTPNKALEYVKIIQSDTVPPAEEDIITVNNPTSAVEKGIKKVELYKGTELVGSLLPSNANSSGTWYWDINVGKIDIHGDFGIVVKCTTGQEGNSFNTGETDQGGTAITIPIYYDIVKEVYSVDGDTAIHGDGIKIEADAETIVYKITVTNSSESQTDLQGAVVTDILPNIFTDVKVSEDNQNWTEAVISGNNEITLTEGLILEPGASKNFYIQAYFADNIAPGAYDNIAALTGKLIEGDTDPSGIIIPPAKAGNLKISKMVTGDRAPEQSFEFVVELPGGIACYYEVFDANNQQVSNGTITSGGIIKIADGQYALIKDIPEGEYSVTEKTVESFTVSSTGESGSIVDKQTAEASFVNAYSHPLGDLKIVKTVINNAGNELQNQSFTFTVVMPEGTTFDPNTITADDGNGNPVTLTQIAGTNSFQLDISVGNVEANNNKEASVIIRDLPLGSYVITETEKNRYEPNFQGTGTAVYTAVIEAAKQTTATCVNTYPVDTGHLKIQKTVTAADGYSAPADQEFTFTVTGKALTRAGYMVSVDEGAEVLYPVTDGKLVLTLKAGQTALIKNLNLDTYQIVETQVDGYVLTSKTGDSGTIAADTTAEAVFTNTYVPRGSLKVTKFVEKAFEADVLPENQEFTFTVTIPAEIDTNRTSYSYTKYHVGSKIEDATDDVPGESGTLTTASNTLTFTLKDGQYIIIEDLPVGAVTVTEAKIDGFDDPRFGTTIDAVQSGGTESFTGTVTKDALTAAFCVNTYQRTTGTLKVTKIVKNLGTGTVPVQEFEFTVELIPPVAPFTATVKYTDKNGSPVKADDTITVSDGKFDLKLQDGWTATIEDLPACQVTVTEAVYDNFSVDWDIAGNTGLVRNEQTLALTCTNTYPVGAGNLIIRKAVTKEHDRDVIPADDYTIQVDFTTGDNNTPLDGTFTYRVFNKNDDPETANPIRQGVISSGDTLTLKEDQYALIYDIPACDFDVRETDATSGLDQFKVSYVHSEGHKILAGQTVTAQIVNTYKRQKGNITISKVLTDMRENDGQDFLFHIVDSTGKTVVSVTLKAGESVTVFDLPVDTYTVKEDTSWSWRYVLKSDNDVVADLNTNTNVTVAFENDRTESQWLNFFTNWLNEFPGS